jgi:adenosylcobyric acid synthase
MTAKKLMVQGTFTGAGKSFLVALLCRIFREEGYRVAPFKLLNWTGVVYRDEEGREFGYSQVLQAVAAGIKPDYRTNPFTPKTLSGGKVDLLIEGRPVYRGYTFPWTLLKGWTIRRRRIWAKVKEAGKRCFEGLASEHDMIVIEGSGPSKVLWMGFYTQMIEIANQWVAETFDAPVILVGKCPQAVPPLLSHLKPEQRERFKGVVLNPFVAPRVLSYLTGKKEREFEKEFAEGVEKEIGLKVYGILPFFEELSKLPPLDPILYGDKVPLGAWEKVISKIAKEARKHLDVEGLLRLAK